MNLLDAIGYIEQGNTFMVLNAFDSFNDEDTEKLLHEGLTHQKPWLVISCLEKLDKKANALSTEQKINYQRLIDLAGIQGDYPLCHRLSQYLPPQKLIEFYPEQEKHPQEALLSHWNPWNPIEHALYLDKHEKLVKKLFALLKDRDFTDDFYFLLGRWRAGIESYSKNNIEPNNNGSRFGIQRDKSSYISSRGYQKYFNRIQAENIHYPICGVINGQSLSMTKFLRDDEEMWIHTSPTLLEIILPYISEKIRLFQHKHRKIEGETINSSIESDVINDIAEIDWWFAHACPYLRGSAAIAKMLVEALFRLASLEVRGWNTEPDCEALISPKIEDYQTAYRGFITQLLPVQTPVMIDPTQDLASLNEISGELLPLFLQELLEENRCQESQALDLINDKLIKSPIARRQEYHLTFAPTDILTIVLGLELMTTEEIESYRRNDSRIFYVTSDLFLPLFSRKLIASNNFFLLAYNASSHMLSKNGRRLLLSGALSDRLMDRYHGYVGYQLSWLFEDYFIALFEKKYVTADFMKENGFFLMNFFLHQVEPSAVYAAFENGLTTDLILGNPKFFGNKDLYHLFFNNDCQEPIAGQYLSAAQAIAIIEQNEWIMSYWCEEKKVFFQLYQFRSVVKDMCFLIMKCQNDRQQEKNKQVAFIHFLKEFFDEGRSRPEYLTDKYCMDLLQNTETKYFSALIDLKNNACSLYQTTLNNHRSSAIDKLKSYFSKNAIIGHIEQKRPIKELVEYLQNTLDEFQILDEFLQRADQLPDQYQGSSVKRRQALNGIKVLVDTCCYHYAQGISSEICIELLKNGLGSIKDDIQDDHDQYAWARYFSRKKKREQGGKVARKFTER